MKFFFSFLFSISWFLSPAQAYIHLPEAIVYDVYGKAVLTTSISNGNSPTVLITYASWSPGSMDFLDEMNDLYNDEHLKSDVKIVAVNCEDKRSTGDVMREAMQHKWNSFEILHDRKRNFMSALKTTSVFRIFFLDADQNIIYCVQTCNITPKEVYIIASSIKNKKITADTVYLNNNWFPCEKPEAKYYRKIVKDSLGKFLVTDYFMSGQIQMQGIYDIVYPHYRTGILTYYYESGQKKECGYYSNNEKTGLWFNWFESGTLQSKINYAYDKKNGPAQEFYPSGKLADEGEYYTGIQNGNWLEYYENEMKKRQTQWNMGTKVWCVGWYDNGKTKFIVNSFKNNLPDVFETFYSNGQKENQFVYGRDSILMEIKQFYETGELKSSSKFSANDTTNYTEYYADGTRKMVFSVYNKTELNGKLQSWHQNGKEKIEMDFKKGQAINTGMTWNEKGRKEEKINFADGKSNRKKKNAASDLVIYSSPDGQVLLFSQTINYCNSFLDDL